MKKAIILLCITILFLPLAACSNKGSKPSERKESEFDIKAATNVINSYMRYLMKEDQKSIQDLYSEDLKKEIKDVAQGDLKIKGYYISDNNEIGRSGQFKIKVTRVNENTPVSTLEEYVIKVIKDGAEYKISEVKSIADKEAFSEGNTLRLKSKDEVKTSLLLDSSGLPSYAYESSDKARMDKKPVPKDKFNNMVFSYRGDKIAICTYDKNSYIGIVTIESSQSTQAQPSGGEGKDEQTGGQTGKQGESGAKAREKPIGKNCTSLDILTQSKVEFMSFSQDEKYLVAQYIKSNAGRCIKVYKTEGGEALPVDFEESYPLGKVEIIFSSFDKEYMYFEVIPKGAADASTIQLIGKYELKLKDNKISKT